MLTPGDFKARWHNRAGSERGLAQAHFLDLRAMLGQDTGETDYVFEQPVTKAGGGQGFADVWKPGHFAVEYKQEGKDLRAAYAQLLAYKDAFGNPPLLVVSDLRRIVIYPNFHNTAATPYEIGIEEMDDPEKLRWLRWLFTDPDKLRPRITRDDVTKAAAARFGAIAARLTARGHDPARVAHLLVQLLFCLFAEDAGVLPKGLVKRTFDFGAKHPDQFDAQLRALLSAMATGGFFNMEPIPVINGGLFAVVDPLPLGQAELTELAEAATLDWSSVEPAIFGTLFERSLDPSSRAQLGAHYTGRADIERVVDPVVMVPLRRRWAEVRATAAPIVERIAAAPSPTIRRNRQAELASLLLSFREELAAVTVLDPACGSGNFLYVALELLLTLDREVIAYGTAAGLSGMTPLIRPSQLRGLEINPYARELAQVVIWIGYLQWMIGNGFGWTEPVLAALETIELRDALLDRTDPAHPKEAEWPAADYIVGNPPFLGAQRLRSELGDAYVEDLFVTYSGRVPHGADLATYFFEKAREHIALRETQRAGLLATQSIRKGASRRILDRIKESGDIFMAWSDEPWTLNGADVRISIIGFDGGRESTRVLDNASVTTINADLTSEIDVTAARQLAENLRLSYKGVEKGGPFEVPGELARRWLSLPTNPNGRPNSDVLRPLINGIDVTRRPQDIWIIDFPLSTTESEAALYEAPFEYTRQHVRPVRLTNRDPKYAEAWWLLRRPVPPMRAALLGFTRYVATPRVARHRTFVWLAVPALADSRLYVFARDDDYFFGVLHSRAHEVWSLAQASRHGVGNDPTYNNTTCFETFPLPWPPGREPAPADEPLVAAVAETAQALDVLRTRWLNPEGATAAELKTRTLTNLYNARPTWLVNAHAALDRAVWMAYGWKDDPSETTDEAILERLLNLNMQHAAG